MKKTTNQQNYVGTKKHNNNKTAKNLQKTPKPTLKTSMSTNLEPHIQK